MCRMEQSLKLGDILVDVRRFVFFKECAIPGLPLEASALACSLLLSAQPYTSSGIPKEGVLVIWSGLLASFRANRSPRRAIEYQSYLFVAHIPAKL
jgi:hypothetical protein